MRRELAKFSPRRTKQTLRLIIEVAVEHPDRMVAAGDVLLQDNAGPAGCRIQVEDFKQLVLASHDCDTQPLSSSP